MNDKITVYEEKYQDEIAEILKNSPVGRASYFQMKYFVIGKEPTHQAKLWRCVQELETKNEEVEFLKLELEEINDKIELIDIECAKLAAFSGEPDLNKREKEVLLRMKERKKTGLLKSKKKLIKKLFETKEEAIFYTEAFKTLNNKESLKPYDDHQSQMEYWGEKLSQDLNLRVLTHKAPDLESIKTIIALPEKAEVKQTVLNMLQHNKLQLEQGNG